MVRHLPEGSRYVAIRLAKDAEDEVEPEPNPELEAVLDQRIWTLDRRLQAMVINAVNLNTAATGMWGKDGPPDFDTVGPDKWQPEDSRRKKQPATEYKDNFDFFRKMGWPVGS